MSQRQPPVETTQRHIKEGRHCGLKSKTQQLAKHQESGGFARRENMTVYESMTLAQVRSTLTLTFKELGKSYGRAAESQQYLPVAIDKLVQNKGHGLGFRVYSITKAPRCPTP